MLELGRLFKRRVCWIYKCPHFPEAEKVSSMFVVCGYIYIYASIHNYPYVYPQAKCSRQYLTNIWELCH